jgi:hypothetical protein
MKKPKIKPEVFKGEFRFERGRPARMMGIVENYVVARKHGSAPFLKSIRDWAKLPLCDKHGCLMVRSASVR